MHKLVITFLALLLLCPLCPAQSYSTYQGNTGARKAIFMLSWSATNQEVTGYYYTTDRPDRRYELTGQNYKEGRLVLKEHTDGEVTAVIRLSKSVRKGQVRWSGTMYNTDGRKIPVTLARL